MAVIEVLPLILVLVDVQCEPGHVLLPLGHGLGEFEGALGSSLAHLVGALLGLERWGLDLVPVPVSPDKGRGAVGPLTVTFVRTLPATEEVVTEEGVGAVAGSGDDSSMVAEAVL